MFSDCDDERFSLSTVKNISIGTTWLFSNDFIEYKIGRFPTFDQNSDILKVTFLKLEFYELKKNYEIRILF